MVNSLNGSPQNLRLKENITSKITSNFEVEMVSTEHFTSNFEVKCSALIKLNKTIIINKE